MLIHCKSPLAAALWIGTVGLTLLCGCTRKSAAPETLTLADFFASDAQQSAAACPGSGSDAAGVNGPTQVDVFLFVLAVNDIDASTNSFQFEGYGGFIWCDPRQAAEEPRTYFGDEQAREFLTDVWFPAMILPTKLGRPELALERVDVAADGTMRLAARFNTRLAARYDFRRFPFDRQTLRIPIQSSRYSASELTVVTSSGQVGFNRGFEIPEWTFVQHTMTIDSVGTLDGGTEFSRFVMEIEIGRKVGFYFWKIFLPVLLIVSVAWSGFWLTREAVGQRQRQAATVFLTIVAFQFVASDDLPRVSALTLMDQVMLWSFFTVGAMLIFNLRSAYLYRRDAEAALRFDRWMRWRYPAMFVTGLALIALISFGRN